MDPSFAFDIANLLLKCSSSPIFKEIKSIWKYEEEINMLTDTIDTIGSWLSRVQGTRFEADELNKGFRRLREVYLDAEDVLDRVQTLKKKEEAMANQIKEAEAEITKPNGKGKLSLAYVSTKMKPSINKGLRFFSSSNQAKHAFEVHSAAKKIKKKLKAISEDHKLVLTEPSSRPETTLTSARATGRYVDATKIIGRDEDKMKIVDLLIRSPVDDNKVPVVSIVGIGGMGKTTVAQLVYKDERLRKECQFDKNLWVSDSKKYDLRSLLKHILKSFSRTDASLDNLEEDHLEERLVDEIQGKRFLLVLDDVDHEDPHSWGKLEALLENGNKEGSRILVTTRSRKVAKVVGSLTNSTYELHGLSEEDSLQLFERFAFQERRAENLAKIGRQIVGKCSGVPLAVKVMGTYLKSKDRREWEFVRDNSFADIRDEENQILPILKLSYDDLDPTVRQCFQYCAIFPRNYSIEGATLKNIWMDNIRLKNRGRTLEDVCDKNLTILLDRCFLDKYGDEDDDEVVFVMHDLMHDLVKEVAGPEIRGVDLNTEVDLDKLIAEENVRHLFLTGEESLTVLPKGKRLRSILGRWNGPKIKLSGIVSDCPVLRMLDLRVCQIENLPDSMGKLIHLRYLDLSSSKFQTLPNSITELINLRYLNLSYCKDLTHLPSGMGALMSLEHLGLAHCEELEELPRGIEKLSKLKSLSIYDCNALAKMPSGMGTLMPVCSPPRFIVGHPESSNHTAQLEELGSLSDLVEWLEVELPMNIISTVPAWDGQAFLLNKTSLRELEIKWQGNPNPEEEVPTNSMDILAKLQPPPNLESFGLDGYQGTAFPPWVSQHGLSFVWQNLVLLCIQNCRRLEYIEDNVPADLFCLPQLEQLGLKDLPEFKGWRKGLAVGVNDDNNEHTQLMPSFPRLSNVQILRCPGFTFSSLLPSLKISALSSKIKVNTDHGVLTLSMEEDDSLSLKIKHFTGTETPSKNLAEAISPISDHVMSLVIKDCKFSTLQDLKQFTALRRLCIVLRNKKFTKEYENAGKDEEEEEENLSLGEDEEEEEEQSVGNEIESTSLHTTHHPHMPLSGLTSLQTLTLCGIRVLPKWASKFFSSKVVSGSPFLLKRCQREFTLRRRNKFEIFMVGHRESFNAQLEELDDYSNVCKCCHQGPQWNESTYLTIVLPHFTWKAPAGDSGACLLDNKILRCFWLQWIYNQNLEEELRTNHIDILGKLQPPLNLKSFRLGEYQGMTFPPWAAQHGFASALPNLVNLGISNCRRCRYLPSMNGLECLKELELCGLSSLEYIEENVSAAPFCLPKLERLVLSGLPELKGWCRGDIQSLLLSSFPRLSILIISACPNLTMPPLLTFAKVSDLESRVEEGLSPRVEVHIDDLMLSLPLYRDHLCLTITNFNATESALSYMAETFRGMSDRLIYLHLRRCSGLKTLLGILQHLSTLRGLMISECPNFMWEEEEDKEEKEKQNVVDEIQSTSHDAHIWWKGLPSLQQLCLMDLPKLVGLPEGIQFLTSLQYLDIYCCDNLLIPEWLHNIFPYKKVEDGGKQIYLAKKEMDGCSSSTSI